MRWDRIAKAWNQVVAKVVPPRSSMPKAKFDPADGTRVASSAGDFYNEPGIAPGCPRPRIERGEFSQHLS